MAAVLQSGYSLTTSTGVASSLTLTAPTGISSGDLLLILVMDDADNEDVSLWETPTDWTSIGSSGGSDDTWTHAFYKISDGLEGNTTVQHSATSDELMGWMLRVTGAIDVNPITVVGTGTFGVGTTITIPALTTPEDDCLVFYTQSFDGGDGLPYSQSGTGWTQIAEGQEETDGSTVSGSFGTKTVTTAGTSEDSVVTADTSDGYAGFQFAINPFKIAIAIDPGTYNTTGSVVNLNYNRKIAVDLETYNTTGSSVELEYNRRIASDTGVYTTTGSEVTLKHNKILVPDAGVYNVTGSTVNLKNNRLIIDSETYSTSTTDVVLKTSRHITVESEVYNTTSSDVLLVHNKILSINSTIYNTIGSEVILKNNRLNLDSGSYNSTPTSVTLITDRRIILDSESYNTSGAVVGIIHGQLPLAYKVNMPVGWLAYNANMPATYISYKVKV